MNTHEYKYEYLCPQPYSQQGILGCIGTYNVLIELSSLLSNVQWLVARGKQSLASIWCKWEQDAATTCNWHMDTDLLCSCAYVQVVLLLHPAPTCIDGCWCLAFSYLCCVGGISNQLTLHSCGYLNAHVSANCLFGPNSKQCDFKGVALGLHRHTGFEDKVHIIMRTQLRTQQESLTVPGECPQTLQCTCFQLLFLLATHYVRSMRVLCRCGKLSCLVMKLTQEKAGTVHYRRISYHQAQDKMCTYRYVRTYVYSNTEKYRKASLL